MSDSLLLPPTQRERLPAERLPAEQQGGRGPDRSRRSPPPETESQSLPLTLVLALRTLLLPAEQQGGDRRRRLTLLLDHRKTPDQSGVRIDLDVLRLRLNLKVFL